MIDTAQKRASLISMGRAWIPFLPTPDGAIDTVGDRAQLAWLYAGELVAPAFPYAEPAYTWVVEADALLWRAAVDDYVLAAEADIQAWRPYADDYYLSPADDGCNWRF